MIDLYTLMRRAKFLAIREKNSILLATFFITLFIYIPLSTGNSATKKWPMQQFQRWRRLEEFDSWAQAIFFESEKSRTGKASRISSGNTASTTKSHHYWRCHYFHVLSYFVEPNGRFNVRPKKEPGPRHDGFGTDIGQHKSIALHSWISQRSSIFPHQSDSGHWQPLATVSRWFVINLECKVGE